MSFACYQVVFKPNVSAMEDQIKTTLHKASELQKISLYAHNSLITHPKYR